MIKLPRHLLVAAALLGLSCFCGAQTTTVMTDPVGFITLPVSAASGATPSLSFRALGLARPIEFQGAATSVSSNPANSPTPDSITCTGAGWIDDQFDGASGAYYVEILGTPGTAGVGTVYDIATTSQATQTITLATGQRLATGLSATTGFRLRKHWTLASVFGPTNGGGLQGGTSTTADQILIFNGTSYDTYYYSVNGGLSGTGWRKTTDDTTDQAGRVLYPDEALIIKRLAATPTNIVLMGGVKTGQSSYPVLAGLNFLSNPYSAAMTLADSGLYTGSAATGLAFGTSTTADQVLIYNGTGYSTYYYSSGGGFAGAGWRRVDDDTTACDTVPIPMGTAFILKRKGSTGFNWVAPQHPASF